MSDETHTHGGIQYDTPREALAAAYLDFVMARSENDSIVALGYAQDLEVDNNLREAADRGWQWPGDPSRRDIRAAAVATRVELGGRR